MPMAFDDVARTAEGHIRLYLYAAVVHLAATLRRLAGGSDADLERELAATPFLESYLAEAVATMPEEVSWTDAPTWWRRELRTWEAGLDPAPPLVALGLRSRTRIALAAALLVEEDARFPAAFASLDGGRVRPTAEALGLVAWTGRPPDGAARRLVAELHGIATPARPEDPLPTWELRVNRALVSVLRGDDPPALPDGLDLVAADELPRLDDVPMAPTTRAAAEGAVGAIAAERGGAVLVRGRPGADRGRVADAIARARGRARLALRWPAQGAPTGLDLAELAVLARATNALVRLDVDLPPGDRLRLPVLPGHAAPLLVAASASGSIAVDGPVLTVPVHPLPPAERRRAWRAAWRGTRVRRLDEIARTHRLPGGWIRRVAEDAAAIATRTGRASVGPEEVREAIAALTRGAMEQLAIPLPTPEGGLDDVVVGDRVGGALHDLADWIANREDVAAAAGTPTAGVRALFSGPSGTGKTLAARAVARQVGLPCFRVDLAAVVSKYIGETEQNLDQVLTRAEELDVVLLLDEGDALLGARTDVRSANDRYANLETNYLLQRLETFDGVIIVTTNVGKQIDPAFQRRMDVVVEFSPPGVTAREELWRRHLPPRHAVTDGDLADLAVRFALTGGQIRNAALRATLRSVTGEEPVGGDDVRAAVEAELVKAGALGPRDDGRRRGIDRFLEALS